MITHLRSHSGAHHGVGGHVVVHEIDGRREGKEKDAHDRPEADEVPQGVGECYAEDCDCLVVAQKVQQLQLSQEGNNSNHNQVDLIVLHDRLKTHDFS